MTAITFSAHSRGADAPVLILDEPTAHLDPPTAERLMEDVLGAAGVRSVLLVTHRPEDLEHVDETVRLEPKSSASGEAPLGLAL
jgi:ABC-type transport system involved in cytochrome bd biosynthesis fused ATPase/permease subunit